MYPLRHILGAGDYNCGVDSYRLFIAAHLPADARRYLGRLTDDLAQRVPRAAVRWVAPPALHLTFAFLGDWPTTQLIDTEALLDRVAAAHAPIDLHLSSLGYFPNASRPRVVWVGLSGPPAALRALNAVKHDLDDRLQTLGWKAEDRLFQPHLTLGRVKQPLRPDALPAQVAVQPLVVPVAALHLMRSELLPQGPRYTTLHSAQLSARS